MRTLATRKWLWQRGTQWIFTIQIDGRNKKKMQIKLNIELMICLNWLVFVTNGNRPAVCWLGFVVHGIFTYDCMKTANQFMHDAKKECQLATTKQHKRIEKSSNCSIKYNGMDIFTIYTILLLCTRFNWKTKWKKNGNDPHEAKATALKLFCENSTILVEVLRSREYDIHIYTSFNCNDKHAL